MSEHDDRIASAYRGLGREAPSPATDAAILAAARRAVAPARRARDWGVPVSIAAVLVLAAGLTLQMQREEPGIELQEPAARRMPVEPPPAPARKDAAPAPSPEPQSAAPGVAAQASKLAKEAPASPAVMQEAPATRAVTREGPRTRQNKSIAPLEKVAPPVVNVPPPASAPMAFPDAAPPKADANVAAERRPAPAAAPTTAPVRAEPPPVAPPVPADLAGAAAAPAPKSFAAPAAAGVAPRAKREAAADSLSREAEALDDPEKELERIARLRADGRDAEADRALEQFRRKRPDYRIAPAMWERVKAR